MSQNYILRRLMQNGGGCGCPTCGQEGGDCGCSGNKFNGGGCGSCSSCGQEGGGCPCSGGNDFNGGCGCTGSMMDGGKVSGDISKWTFVFFNKDSANDGKPTPEEEDPTHGSFLTHVKTMGNNGKSIKQDYKTVNDLITAMKQNKTNGYYINDNLLYGKLNKEGFKGSGNSKTVEFIDLKRKAVKEVVKKVIDNISEKAGKIKTDIDNAANSFKNGLFEKGDDFAVAAVFEIINSLSQEKRGDKESARTKFIKKMIDAGFDCTDKKQIAPVPSKGGFTESFNDNVFINSIFGQQNDEFINSDSESQFGGYSLTISPITEKQEKLKTSITEIKDKVKNDEKLKLLPIPMIDSVIFFEKRITGPAKILGLLSGNDYVNIFE